MLNVTKATAGVGGVAREVLAWPLALFLRRGRLDSALDGYAEEMETG